MMWPVESGYARLARLPHRRLCLVAAENTSTMTKAEDKRSALASGLARSRPIRGRCQLHLI
jgi:hypothetical protein